MEPCFFNSSNKHCGLAQLCAAVQSSLHLAVSRKLNAIFFPNSSTPVHSHFPKLQCSQETCVLLMANEIKILLCHDICRDIKNFFNGRVQRGLEGDLPWKKKKICFKPMMLQINFPVKPYWTQWFWFWYQQEGGFLCLLAHILAK